MSDENQRWEFLHRIHTVHALLFALLGGPAMTFALQAIFKIFSQPTLPWWGDLLVAALCSGLIALLIVLTKPKPEEVSNASGWGGRVLLALVLVIVAGASFMWGRAYQRNAPPFPDSELIANSTMREWGVGNGGSTAIVNVVIDKVGAQAPNYSMVLLARIEDASVNEMTDERIDKSNSFPIALGAREIDLQFSGATITRLKAVPEDSPVQVHLYLIALPSIYQPAQIVSLSSADNLGAKLMQQGAVVIRASQLRLP
jgi:hypothetical protein